jgi:hypothetical protein
VYKGEVHTNSSQKLLPCTLTGGVTQQLAVAHVIRLQCTVFLHVHRSIACLIASCMCYTGISAAAGMAADRMKAFAEPSTGLVCAGRLGALQPRPTADLDIGAYPPRRLV